MDFDPDEFLRDNVPASVVRDRASIVITDTELQKINKKAYLEATYQFLKTAYMREHVRRFAEDGKLPLEPQDSELLTMLNCQADSVMSKPPYMLITVNPRAEVSLSELKRVIAKLISKRCITHYYYVYEVRKADYTGLHCHILVMYTGRPYDFKRSVRNTCKHICDAKNPNILNFKYVDASLLLSKISYMSGDKSAKKLAAVGWTVTYRQREGLEDAYESSPPFPCRATQQLSLEASPLADDHESMTEGPHANDRRELV